MAILTPVLGLSKPVVGADDDVWGNMWNGNADILDTLVKPIDLAPYLLKAGGTMTGDIVLKGNALAALNPVPLQQMNAAIAAIPAGVTQSYVDTADNLRVLKAGDTMTNQLQITAPANASSVGQNLLLNGSISPTIRFHDGTNPAFGMLYYSGSMWLCSFTTPAGTGENDICFFSTSLIEFRKNLSMANNRIRQVGAPLSGDEATNKTYVDGLASTSLPIVNGTAAIGTGTTWARADHIHGSDPAKLSDAPNDGAYYTRRNATWAVAPGSAISTDAPSDGTAYGRLSGAWNKVPWFTAKGNVMVNVPEPATIAAFAPGYGGVIRAWQALINNYTTGVYWDGTASRRLTATDLPGQISLGAGGYTFQIGTAGAADSVVTMPTLFALTPKGNLMLGVPEPANIATSTPAYGGGATLGWVATFANYASYTYYDLAGGTWRRLDATSFPAVISPGYNGGFLFQAAATGAKDSAVTLSQLFTINQYGSIGVGNITLPSDGGGSLVSAANLIVSNAMAINMYFSTNGNTWRYRNNGSAGMIHMDTSSVPMINFYTAPVGTAGAQATISNVLSVRADGVVAFPWFSTSSGATIGADLYVNGNVFVGSSQEWHLYRETSSGDYINMYRSGNGWYDRWRSSDGRRTWCGNNSELLSLDGSGNLTASGTIATQGTVSGAALVQSAYLYSWGAGRTDGSFFMNGGGFCGGDGDRSFGIYRGSGMCILQFAGNWYIGWNTSGGDLRWWSGSNELFHTRTSDWLFWNPTGPVGGMGPYNNYSDRRGKQDIEPTEIGLPEILKLRPVRYTRIAPPESTNRKYPDGRPQPDFIPRSEIGFVAQEVRDVLPDAVVVMGKELPDGTGGLDDPDPTLGMTYDTITAALVNAVQTLNARLAALESTP